MDGWLPAPPPTPGKLPEPVVRIDGMFPDELESRCDPVGGRLEVRTSDAAPPRAAWARARAYCRIASLMR